MSQKSCRLTAFETIKKSGFSAEDVAELRRRDEGDSLKRWNAIPEPPVAGHEVVSSNGQRSREDGVILGMGRNALHGRSNSHGCAQGNKQLDVSRGSCRR